VKLIPLLLLLVGCVSLDEQYDRAYACKESLVLDESGDTRKRTTEEIDRDCGFDAYLKRLDREEFRKREMWCPDGYVVVCSGPSCGRKPRYEGDLRDYSCMSQGDLGRMLRGMRNVF